MRVNPQYEETPKDTFRKLIERQVKEILSDPGAAIFEPFFREKHVSDEIMRRLTMPQIHRWRGVYKKHGCLRCETHDRPHVGCGMCAPCSHVVRERLKAGELGLDIYGMRERLAQKGLVYRDVAADE